MQAPETLSAQAAPAEDRGAHGLPRRHFATEGERKFNWQTYTGVGYFANVVTSLVSVFWAERTQSGQSLIRTIGKAFEPLGVSAGKAEFLARKSFFLTGGFLVVPVMKWLEDDKVRRVKQYNREIYGDAAERDPVIQQSERELEQAPRQTWASFISGRFLALVPFYATVGLLWEKNSPLGKATGGWGIDRPISNISRDMGKLAASRGHYFDHAKPNALGITKLYHNTLSAIGKTMRFLPEDKAAVQQIEKLEKLSPGAVKSVKEGAHDPNHSTMPYYVISEAITSGMVAWGLFVITRMTAPFFDKKPHEASTPAPTLAAASTVAPLHAAGPAAQVSARAYGGTVQEDTPALVANR